MACRNSSECFRELIRQEQQWLQLPGLLWKRHVAIAITLAITILSLDALTSLALAKDPPKTYRRYDDSGRFDGTTREDEEGNLRFYDEKGQYKGYADRQKDGSWRTYDDKGEFDGTIREESD